MLRFEEMSLNQVDHSNTEGNGKCGVADEGQQGVNPEPVALQNRGELAYLAMHGTGNTQHNQSHWCDERAESGHLVPTLEYQEDHDDRKAEKR